MKAKLIDKNISGLTHGQIYDAEQSPTFSQSYSIVNDNGVKTDYWKSRFVLVDLIKKKSAEIKETGARLAVLKKELADLQPPRVGQKYKHKYDNYEYVLAKIDNKYALVCYSGDDVGLIYHLADSLKAAFFGNEYAFTLLSE